MQLIGKILATLFAPLASLSSLLAPFLSSFAHSGAQDGGFALAAIVVSAALITILCSVWAAGEHVRKLQLRNEMRSEAARARSALLFRDALFSAGGQPTVVMGVDMDAPLSFAGGHDILKACLAGPDAAKTAAALEALLENGQGFEFGVLTADRRTVTLRGATVGARVAVFFREERKLEDLDLDGRGVLDALPVPVWVRNKDLALRWVNRAFLSATGHTSFETALAHNVAFDRTEIELAATARDDGEPVEAKRYAIVAGQRRALALKLQPLSNSGIAGTAIDVTDVAQTEIKLQDHIDGLNDVLNSFDTAVAAFDDRHKLVAFNRAFATLWDLPEKWLRARPTDEEFLDRLREERHLPEQRDFASWKRSQTELFETIEGPVEWLWHLPNGNSLSVIAARNGFGGLTIRFKDISDRLRLESTYNMLLQVQRATLDTLEDGAAVVGTDGRIKVANSAFAKLWRLSDVELAEQPHIRRVAELCAERIGRDQTWEIVASGVAASEPERLNEWGKVGRADGKAISLALSRLPDGSTLATFTDLTEAIRFEAELREKNPAAA